MPPSLRRLKQALNPRKVCTVTGSSQRVVIVGAGLSGLSTAMHLAGTGREVIVLEQADQAGGKCGQHVVERPEGTYRFDTGPTVLTLPEVIADCFAAVGEDLDDWVTLTPLDPAYRAQFHDGTAIDVRTNPDAMAGEIAALFGGDEAAGYLALVDDLSAMFRWEIKDFIDRNTDTPLDALRPNLLRLVQAGGIEPLHDVVAQHLRDPRLQRVFTFQSLYAGMSPYEALGIYAVIAYLDCVRGVSFPQGGMYALTQAMVDAATKHGVSIRTSSTVTDIERTGERATAVITADGDRIEADVVVLSSDLPIARRDLLRDPLPHADSLRFSPSCWLMLAGSTMPPPERAHHTISFGKQWKQVFDDLNGGRLMTDPSIMVTSTTVSDPTLAPPGHYLYSVLFPTPNSHAPVYWDKIADTYRDHAMRTLEERGWSGFDEAITVSTITTPDDWQAAGCSAGTPFSMAHSFKQTGPFRAGNLWGENVVFTGAGTRPGVGIPMVVISGRLAAERITGRQPGYRSKAWS